MPEYNYRALATTGQTVKGMLNAIDEQDVELQLQVRDLTLLDAKLKTQMFSAFKKGGGKVKLRDLGEFYHRLGQSLQMGIPIVAALRETAEMLPSPNLIVVVDQLRDSIECGHSLSEAMAQYTAVFDELDLGLLKIGEQTGRLPECLDNLAKYIEWKEEIRSTVKKAVIYPTFIGISIVAIVSVWVGYVLPQMAGLLKDLGVPLPDLTLALLTTSEFLQMYWLELIISTIFTLLLTILALRNPKVKFQVHKHILVIPILGPVVMGLGLARLSRNFATAYRSGMGILNILDMLSNNVLGNRYLEAALVQVSHNVEQGKSLTESFQIADAFPKLLIGAVRSGESTAGLDLTFDRLGAYYDTEVKRSVGALIAAMEPITLMILGGIFGMIILSILLPLYDVVGMTQDGF